MKLNYYQNINNKISHNSIVINNYDCRKAIQTLLYHNTTCKVLNEGLQLVIIVNFLI